MKSRILGAAIVLFVVFLAGCKSTMTTSAILHNQSGQYDKAIDTANKVTRIGIVPCCRELVERLWCAGKNHPIRVQGWYGWPKNGFLR